MNGNDKLALLLFPNVKQTPEDLEQKYPPRKLAEGAKVCRMAPSPTGFMHLGNLYGAIADERLSHQSDGIFYLRIEDTDQKREVKGGVETIVHVFDQYRLPFDEGVMLDREKGSYGPYRQRLRAEFYHICTKWLVEQGMAYPCFMTEDELRLMRDEQAEKKINFGCYGSYSRYRDADIEEIEQQMAAGKPYVIRYRSMGNTENRIKVTDLVRGVLELPESNQDVVLLKSDGIPTYHFAHVVDDHFMRTTHVVRGEEWLATLPIHIQLFAAMGWKPPKYLHTAHLMKMDGSSKRKLSKRKDPELALDFYKEKGYPVTAVKEYLLSLLNSNFEEWRMANPGRDMNDFPFSIKKMPVSGALFDMDKLNDVSKGVIASMSAEEVYALLCAWANEYDPPFKAVLEADKAYSLKALSIGRGGPKPRKDIAVWSEAKDYLGFFYQTLFHPNYSLPENISRPQAKEILESFRDIYGEADDMEIWFDKVKSIARHMGFADNTKDYKKNPENYRGHVGDVSMVLRIAITGRAQSPDLHQVMAVLGGADVRRRLEFAADMI